MRKEYEERRISNRARACMIDDGDMKICLDPALSLLSLLGKKYTLLVLAIIGNSVPVKKNFNVILNSIPYSSSTIISRRLRDLQEFGLIRKESVDGSILYSLTDAGRRIRAGLIPLLRVVEGEYNADGPRDDLS